MRPRPAAGWLTIGLALLALLPLLAVRQVEVEAEGRRALAAEHVGLVGDLVGRTLQPLLGGGPDALIAAGDAVAALETGGVAVKLLLRPETPTEGAGQGFFLVAASRSTAPGGAEMRLPELPGLLPALDDACVTGAARVLRGEGALLAKLAPLPAAEGCWVVLAAAPEPPAGMAGLAAAPWALAGYLVGIGLVAGALAVRRRRPEEAPAVEKAEPKAQAEGAPPPVVTGPVVDLSALVAEMAQRLAATHGNRVSIAVAGAPGVQVPGPREALAPAIARILNQVITTAPAGSLVGIDVEKAGTTVRLVIDGTTAPPDTLRAAAAALGGKVTAGSAADENAQRVVVELAGAGG